MLAPPPLITLAFVATITDVEKLALDLPENQRAVLAAHLLGSLPPVLHDEDEGIAEALRRDAELSAETSSAISLKELDERIERRREMKTYCTRQIIYAITSLPAAKLDPAALLQLSRDHWAIENSLHAIERGLVDERLEIAAG